MRGLIGRVVLGRRRMLVANRGSESISHLHSGVPTAGRAGFVETVVGVTDNHRVDVLDVGEIGSGAKRGQKSLGGLAPRKAEETSWLCQRVLPSPESHPGSSPDLPWSRVRGLMSVIPAP